VFGTGTWFNASAGVALGNGLGTTGTLTYMNSATGTLGNTSNFSTFQSGNSSFNINSGAAVVASGINLANTNGVGNSTLSVVGAGSSLLNGVDPLNVGSATNGTALVSIQTSANATFNSAVNIYATGDLDVLAGPT